MLNYKVDFASSENYSLSEILETNKYRMTEKRKLSLSEYIERIRILPLKIILFCGICLIFAGLYLLKTDSLAYGRSQGSTYQRSGPIILNWIPVIILGLFFTIISIYFLNKKKSKINNGS